MANKCTGTSLIRHVALIIENKFATFVNHLNEKQFREIVNRKIKIRRKIKSKQKSERNCSEKNIKARRDL